MKIKFNNCGIIKYAQLELREGKINIKYGLNGVGKSTIGKCLDSVLNSKQDIIKRYEPYGTKVNPEVSHGGLKSSLYFDGEYVENYLFREDIINKSFEIVVKTTDYDKCIFEIENIYKDMILELQQEDISTIKNNLQLLSDSIKLTSKKELDAKSSFAKGLKKINPETELKSDAIIYKDFVTSPNNHAWNVWFRTGKSFIIKCRCPFCMAELPGDFNSKFESITNSFEGNTLKNSAESNEKLEIFSKFADVKTRAQILQDQSDGEISDQTRNLIVAQMAELNIEKAKLEAIKSIDPLLLIKLSKDELKEKLYSFKLNTKLFRNLGPDSEKKMNSINEKLEILILKVDDLISRIGQLNTTLSKNIKSVSKFVNNFLVISGIPYKIEVVVSGQNNAKTILKSFDCEQEIENPRRSLSFGELNAISLVLFCVEAIKKNHDLIILDDPVSSFDGNKKYAILHQLFSSKVGNNLRGKTILLLTHDFTPVVDFIYNGLPTRDEAIAHYLHNKDGNLSETLIAKSDIVSCVKNELKNVRNTGNNRLRRVVSLRNYYDMTETNESLEYSVLSSLLHLKEKPEKIDSSLFSDLELKESLDNIRKDFTDFNYQDIYKDFNTKSKLKEMFDFGTSVDKIFATRILLTIDPLKQENKVLWKFLNENFHPQNILFYGLDSSKFELVPQHILKCCEELFSSI